MEQWVFWPMAVFALASAMIVIVTPNAVHAALALVANLFSIAVLYLLLDAHFLAAAQVVVYAGAIVVLFLFVIMLLGVDRREDLAEKVPGQRAIGLASVLGIGAITVLVVRAVYATTTFGDLSAANESGNIEALGRLLFSSYLWPFEVVSVLLVVAAIAAMVLGRKRPTRELTHQDRDA
ncbi:MAG: NADH-quinone oxidoreductase subunit J [Actinomycetota bacterium]